MGDSDADLVRKVLAGDREEYAGLVQRYQDGLFRFALGMIRDHDTAKDLVQDSFVKAYSSLRTCRDPDRFRPWIFRILRNRCADYLKEHRRRDVPLDFAPELPDLRHHPEGDLEGREMQRAMARALAAIPEDQREAFLLKHVEGLSYDDMAELLGAGISALKMRVARAREALTIAMRDLGYERSNAV